jgi:Mn-dependent DtxR family transcriptional regulator
MPDRPFIENQCQYLAFIHAYTKIMRQPPAVADFARYFEVTPPTAQRMVVQLAKLGLIEKTPGAARSIRLMVPADELPTLD